MYIIYIYNTYLYILTTIVYIISIIRAFLIEEQKIVKKVLAEKLKAKK